MLDYLRILLDARRARRDERGASAVEYGLLIAGIAALIMLVGLRLRRRSAERPVPEHLPHRRLEHAELGAQLLTADAQFASR